MATAGPFITPLDLAVSLDPDVVSDAIHMDENLAVFFGLLKNETNLPAGAVLFDTISKSLKVSAAPVGAPPSDPDLRLDVEGTGEMTFFTSATQQAVITNAGLVGIGVTIPGSTLTVNGSVAFATQTVTAGTTTLGSSDYFTLANASAGDVNLRLPSLAVATTRNRMYVIKRQDATPGNVVNVIATPGQTIDGVASQILIAQYQSISIIAGSVAEWSII